MQLERNQPSKTGENHVCQPFITVKIIDIADKWNPTHASFHFRKHLFWQNIQVVTSQFTLYHNLFKKSLDNRTYSVWIHRSKAFATALLAQDMQKLTIKLRKLLKSSVSYLPRTTYSTLDTLVSPRTYYSTILSKNWQSARNFSRQQGAWILSMASQLQKTKKYRAL